MNRIGFSSKLHQVLIAAAIVIVFITGFLIPTAVSQPVTAQTPSPTSLQNVTARMDDDNSLVFHIQGSVSIPGKITVQYWSQDAGPFFTAPVSTKGNSFSVEVMRLRPSTLYKYDVFMMDSSNTPVSQYEGTFTTGPLPVGLQDAKIQITQGTPTYGLILMDYNDSDFNGIVAIDGGDQIVWYYQHDKQVFAIAQRDDNNLVFNEVSLIDGFTMTELAPDGREIKTIDDILDKGSISQPHGRWHHETLVQPDNKIWTLGEEIRPVTINGKYTLQTGSTIEEWDMTKGTVTRLVSLFDLLDPVNDRRADSDTTTGFFWQGCQGQYAGITEDWTHANSLDILPDGNILMSIRHLDQVIAIKPDFSGIAWRLGGPESDFSFPNPADQFYHQHYAHMLSNGNILLFDNGNLRPEDQGGQYSRALELKMDFNKMQATKVWEYRSNPDLYASAVGSVNRLSNGNTVVDFGYDDVDTSPVFTLVEANPDGGAVAVTKISSKGKNTQYRTIPIDSLNGEKKGSVSPEK